MIAKDSLLIFDIGMHKGEDTDYYLKKGFKVVAFEANPDLVALCKKTFFREIESGQLVIVEGAIAPKNTQGGTITFYKNNVASEWGTVSKDWLKRNEELGTESLSIEVSIINLADVIREYGMPFFLKVDIEGMDLECIKVLLEFDVKPDYVSIEAEKQDFKKLKADIKILIQAGYSRFKVVQQKNINEQKEPTNSRQGRYLNYDFLPGSSGLFGSDLPGKWKGIFVTLLHFRFIYFLYWLFGDYGLNKKYYKLEVIRKKISKVYHQPLPGWHDLHAKHESVP